MPFPSIILQVGPLPTLHPITPQNLGRNTASDAKNKAPV